jgi:uncharacterized protein YjiS (DUF1127 family)
MHTTMSSMSAVRCLSVGRRGRSRSARFARSVSFVAELPRRTLRALRTWNRRLNDRAYLASLHGFELSEIGLTPMARDGEARKPFWQA